MQAGPNYRKFTIPDTRISQSARAVPKVARIGDQIDEQIGEQNFQNLTQNVNPQDSQRDIGNPLGGFSQIFRQSFYESKRPRLGCILLH